MKRIAIIGNAGGGKSTLARILGKSLDLPVYHVDSIQFQPGWQRTPETQCDRALDALLSQDCWIIDGFGSDRVIERRLKAADTIVFVDYSLPMHYRWACKRQWDSRKRPRAELPANCPEFTLSYSWRLAKVMWEVHKDYRPWFRQLITEVPADTRVIHIRQSKQWKSFAVQYSVESQQNAVNPSV